MKISLIVLGILLGFSSIYKSYGQSSDGVSNYNFHSPLDIPLVLSGNFGEIRPNHFHSGLDIRTNGKTGLPVYAIEEGYVSRVYVNKSGYGKAIYITHPNGLTSVYGHLQDFSNKIKPKVLEKHYSKESFFMNAFFEPHEIPVIKGEIIAFSGNAGSSGGPHLHFEIRDTKTEEVMDPTDFGFQLKDSKRPQITRIRIFPIEEKGLIEGKPEAASFSTVFYNGTFHLKGTQNVEAWGKLGIGVEAIDYLDDSWAKCGISELKMYVNNTLTYHHNVKRFAFSESRYINTFIDYDLYKTYSRKYIRTYKAEPNNPLSIYKSMENNGIITIDTPNKTMIKIVAIDAVGNESQLEFALKGRKQAIPNLYPIEPNNRVQWNEETIIKQDGIMLKFPENSVYSNQDISITTNHSTHVVSPIFKIGERTIPVQKPYQISMKLESKVTNPDKVYIAGIYNGKPSYGLSTSRENNVYTASNKSLGEAFALAIDTIPPTIQAINFHNGIRLSGDAEIRIRIKDGESGISDFRGEVDGKWVLFEQYRTASDPTYYLDKSRLEKGKDHELKFTATDFVGNTTYYSAQFYW